MKKLIFLLMLMPVFMKPQDTLALKNSSSIPSLVIEVTPESVRYKKLSYIDGPDYYISKSEVKYIRYHSGVKDNIDSLYTAQQDALLKAQEQEALGTVGPANKKSEMYLKGVEDAKLYYYHPCGAVGTGISTFFLNFIGLIPAIAILATPPNVKNLNYPSNELWRNVHYRAGYEHKAKRIKQRKVWRAFCTGMLLSSIFYAFVSRYSTPQ